MKKKRVIAGSILRGALFLCPGVITYLIMHRNYPVLVNIMSSLGVEFVALVLIALGGIIVQAVREQKK